MPAPTRRMKPARESKTWLALAASAGASFVVGMSAREKSMGGPRVAQRAAIRSAGPPGDACVWTDLAALGGVAQTCESRPLKVVQAPEIEERRQLVQRSHPLQGERGIGEVGRVKA